VQIADLGHNFRVTNVEAAIGRAQLDKLPGFVSARRSNAAFLSNSLADTPLTLPVESEHKTHSYHQYTVRGPDREKFRAHLEGNGVETGVYYPQCIHQQQAYGEYNPSVPNAEEMAESVVQLPVHPGIEEAELTKIVNTIKEYEW
jgi:dTDP-4-amino-4,6-dideoxygalactose transaminase